MRHILSTLAVSHQLPSLERHMNKGNPPINSRRQVLRSAGLVALATPFILVGEAQAAAILKRTPGGVSSYTTCGFAAADTNSLANNAGIVATSSTIDNSSNLDLEAEISFVVTMGGTTAAPAFVAFYILPLNQDASTYGDGSTALPSQSYQVALATVRTGISSGNTIYGTTNRFPLPRGVFKFAIGNFSGAAFNATSSATIAYRTSNINTNG